MSLKQEERDIMVALEMEKADVNGDNKEMSRMKSNKGLNLYPLFHKFTALLLMQGSRLFNPSQAIPMQRV